MELRFSELVKEVIAYSREEAIHLGHDYVGTEHLLLGIIRIPRAGATKLLNALNINFIDLKKSIEKSSNPTSENGNTFNNLPLTKTAEKVLKIAYLEAQDEKSDIIGTEHVLLSILKDEDDKYNISKQVLNEFGINYSILKKIKKDLVEKGLEFRDSPLIPIENQPEKTESKNIVHLSLTENKEDLRQIENTLYGTDSPLTLFFDTDEFSNEEIAQIISFLSDVYTSVGGDELEIIGTNSLELKRTLELA